MKGVQHTHYRKIITQCVSYGSFKAELMFQVPIKIVRTLVLTLCIVENCKSFGMLNDFE